MSIRFTGFLLIVVAGAVAGGEPIRPDEPRTDRYGDALPHGAIARLGTVRFRYGGNGLQGLAFLPDGKHLVGAAGDGTLRFWEAMTGRPVREIRTPLDIRGFALSSDGKQIAIGGFTRPDSENPWTGYVLVLDAATGKELRSFARDSRSAGHFSLAFTPDGKLLASLDENGVLRIEEVETGVEILRNQFTAGYRSNLFMSADGSTLIVAAESGSVVLWKWQAGDEPRDVKVKAGDLRANAVTLSGDGKLVATGDFDGIVRVADVATGRILKRLEIREPTHYFVNGLCFSPDGKHLVCTYRGGRDYHGLIHVWDHATGEIRARLDAGAQGTGSISISPDSRLVASAGERTLRVWELDSGKEVAPVDEAHFGHVTQSGFFADGAVVTASDDGTVRVWDAATGRQKQKLVHSQWVRGLALSPDGTRIATSSLDDAVSVWDAKTGRQIYKLAGHGALGGKRRLAFSPDGKMLRSSGDDFYLRTWNMDNGKAVFEEKLRPTGIKIPEDDSSSTIDERLNYIVGEATLAPDGTVFVVGLANTLHVFDAVTGNETRTIPTDGARVVSLAISPDNKYLLAGGWGKSVETKLPDGRSSWSSAKNHTISLWELSTGKLVRQIVVPEGGAGLAAFSPDGKTIAAAVNHGKFQIRRWETANGKELSVIQGNDGRVSTIAFSPDGRRLVAGFWDSSALVWDIGSN